jgi:hypothetical protein
MCKKNYRRATSQGRASFSFATLAATITGIVIAVSVVLIGFNGNSDTADTAGMIHTSPNDQHHRNLLLLQDPRSIALNQKEKKDGDGSVRRNRIAGLTRYEDLEVVSWQQVLERFPSAFMARTDETLRIMAAQAAAVPPPKPILNLGMNKAGSSTLHEFFKCAGYKSCHYYNDDQVQHYGQRLNRAAFFHTHHDDHSDSQTSRPSLLETCGYPEKCNAFTQIDFWHLCTYPQHEHLEQMVMELGQGQEGHDVKKKCGAIIL